jgi:hypothetical protein
MMKSLITILAFALALLSPLFLEAAPNTISYNGKLVGINGTPLQGANLIQFTICDQISNGNCPWTEQQTVTFTNGVFSIQLGAVTTLPANIFANTSLYLGVALYTSGNTWEAFTPRQKLTATPFALNANDVLQKDISPQSVSINGFGLVIDKTGKWVGSTAGLQGPAGPPGAPGVAGAPGANSLTSLISIVTESAGANCANSGKKILVGLDSNNNGVLDASEVTTTAFVCNGANGTNAGGSLPSPNLSTTTYGWTQTFGGLTSDDVKGLAIDATGNLYVVGNYTGSFDGLPYYGGIDVFIRKYSPTGQLLWTKVIGDNSKNLVTAIAVEPVSGGIYIGGFFNGKGNTNFNPDSTQTPVIIGSTSGNSHQPYILHLDQNGIYVWVKTFMTINKGDGGITDLVLDENANIYYCGTYGSMQVAPPIAINFNTDQFGNDTKSTLGKADLFVTKLSPTGSYQWTYIAGQVGNYMTAARMRAKGGAVYILAKDKTYNKIFLTTLNSTTGLKTGGTTWAASNFPYLAPTGIAVDSTGSIVVSAIGSTYQFTNYGSDRNLLSVLLGGKSIFPSISNSFSIIQKFDPTFNPLWTQTRGGFGNNGIYSVAVDANNNVYYGGEYTGDLVGSESSIYDPRASVGGSTDIVLEKLNSSGAFQWAETIGSYGSDRLQSVLINNNDIYLGGYFSGGMDANFLHSSRQYISSHGAEDAYVSKFIGIVQP